MGNKLIELKNISCTFPVKGTAKVLRAVHDVSLSIYEGEVLGLVGESGCGKSTLGQMVADLIPPTSGQILYQGQEIREQSKARKKEIRKEIQMIFQDPYASLNPQKKIGWLIGEPLVIHSKLSKKEINQKVEEMLSIVGLDASYKEMYPRELSGGQRQRVSIAIALMLEPRFIVADEAVSALDISIQAQILNLLKKLQLDRKLTYLFISHDLNVIHYVSDRIGVMYLGQIMELGDVKTVYENPLHPYTKALLSAIPHVDDLIEERIHLEGDVPSPIDLPTGCPFHTRCNEAESICTAQCPQLKEMTDGRLVRCHFAE